MKEILSDHAIEPGCHIYTYEPALIDWWDNDKPSTVSIETGQYERDGSFEVLIFIDTQTHKELAFQTTFIDKAIKQTFLCDHLGKNNFHTVEMNFDDEDNAWTTDSYEDSARILKTLLAFTKDTPLKSKQPGKSENFKTPPDGQHLEYLKKVMEMNSIGDDAEEIYSLLTTIHDNSIMFFIDIQDDLNKPRAIASSKLSEKSINTIRQVCENIFSGILSCAQKEFSMLGDAELTDNDLIILLGLILDQEDSITAGKLKLGIDQLEEQRLKIFEELGIDNREMLIEALDRESLVNMDLIQ